MSPFRETALPPEVLLRVGSTLLSRVWAEAIKSQKRRNFFLLGVDDFFLHLQQECEIKFITTTDKNADYDFIFGLAGILLIRGGH